MAGVSGGIALAGGLANAYSAVKGAGGGGAKIPKWQKKAMKENWKYGKDVAANMTTAGFTPDQLTAQQGIRDSQGYLDADLAAAQAQAGELSQDISPDDIRTFYNPFENDVVNTFIDDLGQIRGMEDLRVNDLAEKSKAFGGDRDAVYRATSMDALNRTAASNIAGLRHAGYQTASGNAMQNRALRLTGNAQLADLISQRRENRFGELGALGGSGALQQAQDQFERDLGQRQLDVRMRAAGTPAPQGGGTYQNPLATGLAAFQDGVGAVRNLQSLWGRVRGPTKYDVNVPRGPGSWPTDY